MIKITIQNGMRLSHSGPLRDPSILARGYSLKALLYINQNTISTTATSMTMTPNLPTTTVLEYGSGAPVSGVRTRRNQFSNTHETRSLEKRKEKKRNFLIQGTA
ncbi:hypothetical protein AAC387_Pa01g2520 [Persea americana]